MIRLRGILPVILFFFPFSGSTQLLQKAITRSQVERIERILAADDMEGRKTFTPGIDKAAAFLEREFELAGLQKWPGLSSFRQSFTLVRASLKAQQVNWDGQALGEDRAMIFTVKRGFTLNSSDNPETIFIGKEENLIRRVQALINGKKDLLIVVDTSQATSFKRLRSFRQQRYDNAPSFVFILAPAPAKNFSISATHELKEMKLSNVVGILPGKKKKDEYVVFSGHYDHLGITKPNKDADSIYNGANDDASGVTAVVCLANYFKKLKGNERTLVFVAFTAEEIGGYGSRYFSEQLDPARVMAMFNIEMIGTESKWGRNSAFITGYEMTDFGSLLEKNLAGSKFKFYPDPYPEQQLFYRSDNATLARLGVPAHTISTSKMDSEKFYHTLDDEMETLDMDNMTEIIRAIAISAMGFIKGTDTPSRVKTENLR